MLLVGLGNPGVGYAFNRHNVGFMVIEQVARTYMVGGWQESFHSFYSSGKIIDQKIMLLMPQTFMNKSGLAVRDIINFYKISLDQIIVFHDDIDLEPGQIKVKIGGGSAGHNGLRSIDNTCGNGYYRIRIGVGRPKQKTDVVNYVLSNFSNNEYLWLKPLITSIIFCLPLLLSADKQLFVNEVKKSINNQDR